MKFGVLSSIYLVLNFMQSNKSLLYIYIYIFYVKKALNKWMTRNHSLSYFKQAVILIHPVVKSNSWNYILEYTFSNKTSFPIKTNY